LNKPRDDNYDLNWRQ